MRAFARIQQESGERFDFDGGDRDFVGVDDAADWVGDCDGGGALYPPGGANIFCEYTEPVEVE